MNRRREDVALSMSDVMETASPEPDWDRIAQEASHRPWPAPTRPWTMSQVWRDLLFAHWRVAPAVLRSFVPAALELDLFASEAWISVVPFRISHLALRRGPRRIALVFPELNVRTYVTVGGKPGVWFFSLDASSPLAVAAARAAYFLPYFWADMRMTGVAGTINFTSRRRLAGAPAAFAGHYKPTGPVSTSEPGSLDSWLTERYCLYAANRAGRVFRCEILHPPWPLQPATADITTNTMTAPYGIALEGPPLLHFARRIDVIAWPLERVG